MRANTAIAVNKEFALDVLKGLSSKPKSLPSKYFYDEKGDALFQEIMGMPEYYLTDCELEIFENNKNELLNDFGKENFDLVELGAGDGFKTKILIEHFLKVNAGFRYIPTDISGNALRNLTTDLTGKFPNLKLTPVEGDFLTSLKKIQKNSYTRKVLLFLGSSIGNMRLREAGSFLRQLTSFLDAGDLLLIGFDLKKDPHIILDAYNDETGITRDFNLNLLERINRELDADFDTQKFIHWETYDPVKGAANSHLVSRERQQVKIKALKQTFDFDAWEPIHTEISQKFSMHDIQQLARFSGCSIVKNYQDKKGYFVDSLWRVEEKRNG